MNCEFNQGNFKCFCKKGIVDKIENYPIDLIFSNNHFQVIEVQIVNNVMKNSTRMEQFANLVIVIFTEL